MKKQKVKHRSELETQLRYAVEQWRKAGIPGPFTHGIENINLARRNQALIALDIMQKLARRFSLE